MSNRRALQYLTAITLGLVILQGCSTVEFTPQSRQAVRNVQIESNIPMTGSISGSLPELQSDSRGAAWFGTWFTMPIGIALELVDYSDNRTSESNAFNAFLKNSKIDVSRMVRNKFMRHLAGSKMFDSIYAEPGEARFKLAIEHGISDGFGLRGAWKPWLTVTGTLETPDGEILWRYEAAVTEGNSRVPEVQSPTTEQDYLRRAYAIAAEEVAQELVKHLVHG